MDHASFPADAAHREPPKRWHRRKRERPAEILAAAVAELSSKGFQTVRMEDIARRAGITKGTIYLYFRSKVELFKCLGLELQTTDWQPPARRRPKVAKPFH